MIGHKDKNLFELFWHVIASGLVFKVTFSSFFLYNLLEKLTACDFFHRGLLHSIWEALIKMELAEQHII